MKKKKMAVKIKLGHKYKDREGVVVYICEKSHNTYWGVNEKSTGWSSFQEDGSFTPPYKNDLDLVKHIGPIAKSKVIKNQKNKAVHRI